MDSRETSSGKSSSSNDSLSKEEKEGGRAVRWESMKHIIIPMCETFYLSPTSPFAMKFQSSRMNEFRRWWAIPSPKLLEGAHQSHRATFLLSPPIENISANSSSRKRLTNTNIIEKNCFFYILFLIPLLSQALHSQSDNLHKLMIIVQLHPERHSCDDSIMYQ